MTVSFATFVVILERNPNYEKQTCESYEVLQAFSSRVAAENFIKDEQRKFNDRHPGYHEINQRWVIKEVELS